MTTPRKHFVRPDFLSGKSGADVADDAVRILHDKPDSHSATAMVYAIASLWDEKDAQSKRNAGNATKPRAKDKDDGHVVTADEIEQSRKSYVAHYERERGFWTYAAAAFDLSARTLKRRWEEKFGIATAKAK